MKKLKKLFTLLIVITTMTLTFAGCSSKDVSNALVGKNTLDFGTFNGTEYTQPYFKMTLKIPDGWYIMDDKTKNSLYNQSVEALKNASSDSDKTKYDLSKEKNLFMFVVSEKEYSQDTGAGSNFIFETENLGLIGASKVKNGKDYLNYVEKNLKSDTSATCTFGDITSQKYGNKEFYTTDITTTVNGQSIKQKYYCTIQKGYALSFIATYLGDEKSDAPLDTIMNTIKFK